MDRPRLRPLEAFPITENGQQLLALRDPSGLTDAIARLPPGAVAIVQLCTGDSTRDEICKLFADRYRTPLPRETLDRLLEQLDQGYFLDSDRFRQHSASVFADFARSPVRPAHLAGKSYPADPGELSAQLARYFTPPNGPGQPTAKSGPLPAAIVAPHIDFARGGPAYAWAYKPLAEATELPELIIVFGTNHAGSDRAFSLTRKDYATPLGAMRTDVALVDALVERVSQRLGPADAEALFADEHHHRGEHSLEFQMVWLRYILGDAADSVKVLPILCGSMGELLHGTEDPDNQPLLRTVLDELPGLTAGRRTLYIAGVDLAHVGPRFGHPDALDKDDRVSLERRDQQTLGPVQAGDATAWFEEIRREKDARNVCGVAPIYAMLRASQVKNGKLLCYAQCAADDQGGSLVTIASLVYPAATAQ